MRFTVFALSLLLIFSGAACESEESKPVGRIVYTITREWSNGSFEKAEVYGNGAVIMEHGDFTERIRLPEDQMAQLAAAAVGGIQPGSNSDDPVIGVATSSLDKVRPAALNEGSLAELLNRLLDDHTLNP